MCTQTDPETYVNKIYIYTHAHLGRSCIFYHINSLYVNVNWIFVIAFFEKKLKKKDRSYRNSAELKVL